MTSPTADFRRELKTLRDLVLTAIDGSAIGDVEDGLDLYARLTSATLRTFNDLRARTELEPNSSWFNPYGQEMEWLETDIRTFVDRMFANFNDGVFDVVVRFLLELLNEFWESKELGAHKRFLDITQRAYWDALNLPSEISQPAGSILVSVRSHGSYRLAHARPQFSDDMVFTAIAQVVDFFFEALRLSLLRSSAGAERCVIEIHELLESLEFAGSNGRTTSSHQPASLAGIQRIRAFALGTSGYLLNLNDRGLLDDEPARILLDRLATLLPTEELWTALVETTEDFGRDFPWSHWEMSLWPAGQQSGVLGHMTAAMDEAVGIRLIGSNRPGPYESALGRIEPTQAAGFVQRVTSQLDVALVHYGRLWSDRGLPDITELRSSLAAIKIRFDEEDQEARHRLELVPEKVAAFLDAAEEGWLVKSPLQSAVTDEVSDENPPDEIFGNSSLMPKDFFTGSQVYADPARVGTNLANALRRGESVRVIEALHGASTSDAKLSELREQVRSQLQRLRGAGCTPSVIAVNSWRVAHALTGSYNSSGSPFEGATVEVDYAGEVALCIVADFQRAVRVRRWRMVPQRPEDQLRASGLLLGGIRDVTDEFALELIEGNIEFRRSDDGTFMPVEEAKRRLRNRVAAKLFCKLAINLVDPNAAHVIRVDEDN